ncbi:MAG: TrmH family RNA methyltransferase, partial [Bacteroidota bacterium]
GMKGVVPGHRRIVAGGQELAPEHVIETLDPFVSEERRRRVDSVLAGRTRTVVPVVEGIVNMGNVSAVMRTSEALGYQDLHLITGATRFKNSPRTSIGAEKWIDVYHWASPADCAQTLRSQGYRIVATHLDETARDILELDFTRKTARVLGNERDGVSEQMLDLSDERCILPMTGFAQSYNISVAAAIALYRGYEDRLRRQGHHGDLSAEEVVALRALFYFRSVRGAEAILSSHASRSSFS